MAKKCGRCNDGNAPLYCPTCQVNLCRMCITFFGRCLTCNTRV